MLCNNLAGALGKICSAPRLIFYLFISLAMADISDGIVGRRNNGKILNKWWFKSKRIL